MAGLNFKSNIRNAKLIIPVFFPKLAMISDDFKVKQYTAFTLL